MSYSPLKWLANFIHPPKEERIGVSRRAIVFGGLGGLAGATFFRAVSQGAQHTYNPALIRPPGSLPEKEFLATCVKCGECMKVCPTNALQPTFLEAGLEGVWSPILKMNYGYCEYGCNLCGLVCPTGAIRKLELEEKQKQTKIGMAFFDKNRCLPFAFGRSCMVCEEHCPTPEKAIWFEEVEVMREKGVKEIVKQPHVNPDLCVGCGICSFVCPIKDQPGIYVTSVCETRHPENQMLLTNSAGGDDVYGN
ncbi:MAG: 4Fe-4S dicluster domain-containing protein [Candidatus Omnitrophota bacterium]